MLFYIITIIILLIYFFYPRSKWEASVVLFSGLIINSSILGQSNQFLGFIDHRAVVAVLLIYNSFRDENVITVKKGLDEYKLYSFALLLFLGLFIARYFEIKESMILLGDFETILIAKRVMREIIYFYAILQIMRRMYDFTTLRGLDNGILFGMIIGISSMVFYDFFIGYGFELHQGYVNREGGGLLRLSGFFGMNSNAAAGLFNIVYGYVLAKSHQNNSFSKKHITLIGLVIIGLMIVASKAGLVVFILLTIIYMFKSATSIKTSVVSSIILILLGIIIFQIFGDYMAERVRTQVTGEFDTFEARQRYWLMYLNDIYNNPEYLAIGNLSMPTYYRDVHNTYIHYLFFGGLVTLIVVLTILWKLFEKRFNFIDNVLYYTPLYSLLALMVSWITGAGDINYWFVLIMAASPGIPKTFVEKNENLIPIENKEEISNLEKKRL